MLYPITGSHPNAGLAPNEKNFSYFGMAHFAGPFLYRAFCFAFDLKKEKLGHFTKNLSFGVYSHSYTFNFLKFKTAYVDWLREHKYQH